MADTVDRLARRYLDALFEVSPITATFFGVHAHDDRLDELDAARRDAVSRRLSELRAEVTAVVPTDAEEAADRDALAAAIAGYLFVEEVERPWHRNPFEAATAIPSAVLLLVAREFAPLEERLGSVVSRLEAAPRFLAQARELLDEPCPALWRGMATGAARGGAGFLAEALGPLAAGTRLAGRVEAAAEKATAALEEFAGWLEAEHAARFPGDAPFAIGEQALARKLREAHCFDTPPAGFVAIGEQQLSVLDDALAEQARRLGSDDWPAKLDEVKGRHPSQEELLPAYRRELDRLEQFVFEHDLATNPEARALVEATPGFLRPVMGYAAYLQAGPFDAYQQGYFWVTPPPEDAGLRDHSWASIPAIAAHEGYPGHHLQISSVNRLESLTRRAVRSPVMQEGWGLYTEQLMADVGYYGDEARLAQLSMRLFRALRIVLDMRLSAGELGYEAAVERAVAIGRLAQPTARSEVARYTMSPTQPFSYLVGCLELERLRAESQARLGDAFRLRRFHDRVLSYGHMPPALVARAMAADDEDERRRLAE
ncbi:MAG TPA: DUF885 domain-containing protein [Actinomycetota bacterium]|nr:DUF885 domain-containing protein [Actinomycetota bacterium]